MVPGLFAEKVEALVRTLPKHLRVCKAKQAREGSSGIRPTMTDGINLTRGAYE